jgi:predicted nuclease with TOPRIM domain
VAKFIPVEPEKWAEMVKALALVAEMDKTINASQAECRRLKEKSECQAECLEAFDKENARIKAEVERLTAMANENAHLHKGIYSLSLNVVQLKDEVERLTNLKSGADYFKAEEGKQS